MIRLQQRPLFGFLADPLGRFARAIELDGNSIRITRRGRVDDLPLRLMVAAPSIRKGMLGTSLTIRSGETDVVTLKGAGNHEAHDFSAQVSAAWTSFNLGALEREAAQLDRTLAEVLDLAAPSRYPAACQLSPALDDARRLEASLLSKLNIDAIGPEAAARIAPVRKFAADPRTMRADGWSNEAAATASSLAACAIRPVSGRRKFRTANSAPSQSRRVGKGSKTVCRAFPAEDGSLFHPSLAHGGKLMIGAKGEEMQHLSFEEALSALQKMATPRWRRPNEAGNWGIVSGRDWKPIERRQLMSM